MFRQTRRWFFAKVSPSTAIRVFDLFYGRTRVQRRITDWWLGIRARADRKLVTGPVRPVRIDGRAVLAADASPGFSAARTIRTNWRNVIDALSTSSIDFTTSEPGSDRPAVVTVSAADVERATDAIAAAHRHEPIYSVRQGPTGRPGKPVLAAAPHPGHRMAESATVFLPLAAGPLVLAGPELGCRLLTKEDALAPVSTEADFPVDAVYTWVDGADPVWAARKAEFWRLTNPGQYHESAANPSRYASHGELRYSLRSLEYYADWIRHVYIITDGQVPHWLDVDNPRITVVDHKDIFSDPAALPTFNSHAIEAQLHHIDGLSEHFVYLNDDVFFGRPVNADLFYLADGQSKFFLSDNELDADPPSVRDLPVDSAAKRNRSLIEDGFGHTITRKFKHVGHAQRRSVLAEIEATFPHEFSQTTASRFRSPEDISIPSALAHHYGAATSRAAAGDLSYRYCDIADDQAQLKLLRLQRDRDADMFCLNEIDSGGKDPVAVAGMVREFLDTYFPVASSFELATRVAIESATAERETDGFGQ